MFFNKKECHQHEYRVMATDNESLISTEGIKRTYTHVLIACKCGELEVETHSGTFKMEDFKKIDDYVAAQRRANQPLNDSGPKAAK